MPGGSGYSDFPSPNNPWSIPTFLSEEDPEDIYRTQWSPPALQPRFLESILNPVDSEPPPSNQSARPPRNPRPFSPLSPHFTHSSAPSMPPSRSARLPSGYVDLTNDSNISPEPTPPKRRRSPSPGSSKRLKRNVGTEAKKEGGSSGADIQEIDLSDDKADIRGVLEKQRVETIKAEANPEEKAITFNTFTCVICMDAPKDLTATSCGHLFCHTCINEALIAGENRTEPGETKRSQCPVCRKQINRTKSTDIIPLLFLKRGLASQPRRKSSTTAAKIR